MDIVPYSYSIKYAFFCAAQNCSERVENVWIEVMPFMKAPLPKLPSYWRQFGTDHYCPKHRIKVVVENE